MYIQKRSNLQILMTSFSKAVTNVSFLGLFILRF